MLVFPVDIAFLSLSYGSAILYNATGDNAFSVKAMLSMAFAAIVLLVVVIVVSKKSERALVWPLGDETSANIAPSWNVPPSQEAMVVRRHPEIGERRLDLLRWGFVPHWLKDPAKERKPINARAETVATTTMFRDASTVGALCRPTSSMSGRGLRWREQPYAIARSDGRPLTFAGWRGPAHVRDHRDGHQRPNGADPDGW
jgi:putative SOS response-associated peptidase YedK